MSGSGTGVVMIAAVRLVGETVNRTPSTSAPVVEGALAQEQVGHTLTQICDPIRFTDFHHGPAIFGLSKAGATTQWVVASRPMDDTTVDDEEDVMFTHRKTAAAAQA